MNVAPVIYLFIFLSFKLNEVSILKKNWYRFKKINIILYFKIIFNIKNKIIFSLKLHFEFT